MWSVVRSRVLAWGLCPPCARQTARVHRSSCRAGRSQIMGRIRWCARLRLLGVALVLLSAACGATQPKEPTLTLWALHSQQPVPIVASATELHVQIRERTEAPGHVGYAGLRPEGARSLTPDVLEIVSKEEDQGGVRSLVVRGNRVGMGRLLVEHRGTSRTLTVRVAEATTARLVHQLERLGHTNESLAYLAGASVLFRLELITAAGEHLSGTVDSDAVSVAGPGDLVRATDHGLIIAFAGPSKLRVRVRGADRTFSVVSPNEVATVDLALRGREFGGEHGDTRFDETWLRGTRSDRSEKKMFGFVRARLRDGRIAVGIDGVMNAAAGPAGICQLHALSRPWDLDSVLRFYGRVADGYHPGFALVGGTGGACRVQVHLDEHSAQRTVTVR